MIGTPLLFQTPGILLGASLGTPLLFQTPGTIQQASLGIENNSVLYIFL